MLLSPAKDGPNPSRVDVIIHLLSRALRITDILLGDVKQMLCPQSATFGIRSTFCARRSVNESLYLFAAPNPMKGVRPPWQSNRVHHCEKCRTNALSHRERVAAGRVRVSSRRRPANRRPSSGLRPPSPGERRTCHTGGTGLSNQPKCVIQHLERKGVASEVESRRRPEPLPTVIRSSTRRVRDVLGEV